MVMVEGHHWRARWSTAVPLALKDGLIRNRLGPMPMRKQDRAKTLKGKQPCQPPRNQRAGQASSPGFKLCHVHMGTLVRVYVNLKARGEAR